MSLTAEDLQAIKVIVNEAIDTRVPVTVVQVVRPMLDALEDRIDAKLQHLEHRLTHKIEDLRLDFGMHANETSARLDKLEAAAQ